MIYLSMMTMAVVSFQVCIIGFILHGLLNLPFSGGYGASPSLSVTQDHPSLGTWVRCHLFFLSRPWLIARQNTSHWEACLRIPRWEVQKFLRLCFAYTSSCSPQLRGYYPLSSYTLRIPDSSLIQSHVGTWGVCRAWASRSTPFLCFRLVNSCLWSYCILDMER